MAAEKIEVTPQVIPDVFFPIGMEKPAVIFMQHYAYLGITAEHIIEKDKQYFLQLSGKEFSVTKSASREDALFPFTLYELIHHKIVVASTRQFGDKLTLCSDPHAVSQAAGTLDNILTIPVTVSNLIAFGTIEGCINGIRANQYHGFLLEKPPLGPNIEYDHFNPEKVQLLIKALSENHSLKTLSLRGINLSKTDFLALIKTLKNRPHFLTLDLANSIICITQTDMPEVMEILSSIPNVNFIFAYNNSSVSIDNLIRTWKAQSLSAIPKGTAALISEVREKSGMMVSHATDLPASVEVNDSKNSADNSISTTAPIL